MSISVRPHRRQPTKLPHPWDSPGKNTGMGCHFLLQSRKVKVKSLSRIRLLATPWTAAHQAPPSMRFSRQEYWSGVPLPSPHTHCCSVTSVVSDSVRPHRQQPTRLPRPWDCPGKNTRVGCHFLLQCRKVKVKSLSRVWLLVTPWTAACQAPLSMGFSRQEYWSGVPLPSPILTSMALIKRKKKDGLWFQYTTENISFQGMYCFKCVIQLAVRPDVYKNKTTSFI